MRENSSAGFASSSGRSQPEKTLLSVGVPVGEVVMGHLLTELDQLQHRGFFEDVADVSGRAW